MKVLLSLHTSFLFPFQFFSFLSTQAFSLLEQNRTMYQVDSATSDIVWGHDFGSQMSALVPWKMQMSLWSNSEMISTRMISCNPIKGPVESPRTSQPHSIGWFRGPSLVPLVLLTIQNKRNALQYYWMLWTDSVFSLMLADTDRKLNSTSNKTKRSKISLFIKKLLHFKKWVNLFRVIL